MSEEPDPGLEEFGRKRLLQLCAWREVIAHGSDEERRKLVTSLREIDYEPLASTLDAAEEEVRTTASEQRTFLALDELRRLSARAIAAGDFDTAAQWLDLRLSVEDPFESHMHVFRVGSRMFRVEDYGKRRSITAAKRLALAKAVVTKARS